MSTTPQQVSPATQRKVLIGLLIVVFLMGGAGLWAGYSRWSLGSASMSWASIDGTVTSSLVNRSRAIRRNSSSRETDYYARVSYRFVVEGKSYTGDQVRFDDPPGGTGEGGKQEAEEFVERFSTGSKVSVYYDPEDPESSVLIQGTTGTGVWIPGGLGILAWLFGFWLLSAMRKQKQKDEDGRAREAID